MDDGRWAAAEHSSSCNAGAVGNVKIKARREWPDSPPLPVAFFRVPTSGCTGLQVLAQPGLGQWMIFLRVSNG